MDVKVFKNARQEPKVYYGMHFEPGVAEYREPGKDMMRVLINEATAKSMDTTFPGKPVYVFHVDEVDLANIQMEADGFVVESFFNKADGKHWCKFIVVSDKGHDAVRRGFRLSNAYVMKGAGPGSEWHGVPYHKEVTSAQYEHLALVDNPRYEDSVILTPEEFKKYNSNKEAELLRLANDKGDKPMLKLFNRKEADNDKNKELLAMSVTLPKSKKEGTVEQFLNDADEAHFEIGKPEHMANGEHMVDCGAHGKMSVNALHEKYNALHNEIEELKKNKSHNNEEDDEEKKKKEKELQNAKEAKDKAEAELKSATEAREKAEKALKDASETHSNFEKLKNAPARQEETISGDEFSAEDKVARGRARYGSGN